MTRGRILSLLLLVVLATGSDARTLDVFLEEMRVGGVRGAADIPMSGPWPRDLFGSLDADRSWLDVFDAPASDGAFAAVAVRALGGDDALQAWLEREARDHRRLAERNAAAGVAWHERRFADCASLCRSILDGNGLDAETNLVWSLRLRAAEDPTGSSVTESTPLWPELFDLGSYDLQSGWDIWTAHRRALGLPLLPNGALGAEETTWLMRLRESHLGARDVDRARIEPAVRAALGAACLPRYALPRHFGLYPDPPGETALAAAWARGYARRAGHTVAAVEHLGALAALPWTVRADSWRRAADKHISAGRWAPGRAALTEAVDLARRSGRRYTKRRVGEECGRAAALARHQGLTEAAAVYEAWSDELDPAAAADPAVAAFAETVRAGRAADVTSGHPFEINAVVARVEERIGEIWSALGVRLAARPGVGAPGRAYGATLADGDRAGAIGGLLADHPLRDEILAWALVLDLEGAGDGSVPVDESPVPGWSRGLGSGPNDQLVRHAIYGLCLLAGDARGRLACAVSLSRPGLTAAENRLFLYPLPDRPSILAAVQGAPDPALVLAVARNESLFDPGVRSRAGALGWMQVMPFHFPGNGVERGAATWRIPANSVRKGLSLLEEGRRRYDGDPYRALAAYNAGPGAVTRWDRQLGGSASRADFLGWIGYPETRRYVEKVLIDRLIYGEVLKSFSEEGTSGP